MAALQCEICGGKLMAKAGGLFECEYCGMQYDKTRIQEMVQEIKGTVKVEGTVEVTGTVKVEGSSSAESLLKRGMFALEDSEWKTADEYFDKVLDINPESAEAYLGKLLAEQQVKKQDDLKYCVEPFDASSNYQKSLRFADEKLKRELTDALNNIFMHPATAGCKIEDNVLCAYEGEIPHVVIPNGVTSIGRSAFSWHRSLASAVIPDSVTGIEDCAFCGCSKLKSVAIPENVTSIGAFTFAYCESLKAISIPENVKSIGDSAFLDCKSLKSITIPKNVIKIGAGAFAGCKSLKEIIVSNENGNFCMLNGCLVDIRNKELLFGLADAAIPDNGTVTRIGQFAFSHCKSLDTVIIPQNVTSFGENAFSNCKSLKSITIPKNVIKIGAGAFEGCKSLKEIIISNENKNFCMVNGCLVDIRSKKLLFGFSNAVIPDDGSVTRIEDAAFAYCESLESLSIPNSITKIGGFAFWNCKKLKSIMIPESVTSIGEDAFGECDALTIYTSIESFTWRWAKRNSVAVEDEKERIAQLKREEEERIAQQKREEEARIAKQKAEEEKKIAEEAARRVAERKAQYRAAGLCQHCGGELKGLFSKKCVSCGISKDY